MIPDWEYTFEAAARALDSEEALSGVQLATRKEKIFLSPAAEFHFAPLTKMIETLYQLFLIFVLVEVILKEYIQKDLTACKYSFEIPLLRTVQNGAISS